MSWAATRNLPTTRRALAVVDRLIEEAETAARCPVSASSQGERLMIARVRLALLRRSRHCLLTGELQCPEPRLGGRAELGGA